jgi:hypothetical protein
MSFRGASFLSEARFTMSIFRQFAQFPFSTFRKLVSFDTSTFEADLTFHGARFGTEPIFEQSCGIGPEGYDSIGLTCRTSGLSCGGRFFENAGQGYCSEGKYSEASDSFRNAKVEYEKEGDYDKAGEIYVNEMECRRLNLRKRKGISLRYAWLWALKHNCNYGESPLLFIKRLAIIILAFAIIYMPIIPELFDWWPSWLSVTFKEYPFHQWAGGAIGIIKAIVFNFVTALYFSAVTFATLGFGDIAPISVLGKLYTILEVLLGYIMFGVLITLVARKMTRS